MNDDQKPFHLSVDDATPLGETRTTPIVTNSFSTAEDKPTQTPAPQTPPISLPLTPSPSIPSTSLNTASTKPTPTQNIPVSLQPPITSTTPLTTQPTPPDLGKISPPPVSVPTTPVAPSAPPIRPPILPTQPFTAHVQRAPATPTPPRIVIRTMESDIQTGGKTTIDQPITSQTSSQPSSVGSATSSTPQKKSKFGLLIGILVILGIIGVAGYFGYDSIAPLFSQKQTLPIPQATPQEEQPPMPSPSSTSPISPQSTFSHTSLFTKPAEKTVSANVNTIALENIKTILSDPAVEPEGTLKEIVLNIDNKSMAFVEFGQLFLQGFPFDSFDPDFTLAIFYDKNGAWPVVVAKLKNDTQNLILTKSSLRPIIEEGSTGTITQLFLQDPGIPTPSFLDGGVGDITKEIRYHKYDGQNSLNYGWLGNKFIIATSYAALKATIMHLQ